MSSLRQEKSIKLYAVFFAVVVLVGCAVTPDSHQTDKTDWSELQKQWLEAQDQRQWSQELLERTLHQGTSSDKQQAAYSIGQIGDANSIKGLEQIWMSGSQNSNNLNVLTAVLNGFALLHHSEACSALQKLHTPDHSQLQAAMIKAVAHNGCDNALLLINHGLQQTAMVGASLDGLIAYLTWFSPDENQMKSFDFAALQVQLKQSKESSIRERAAYVLTRMKQLHVMLSENSLIELIKNETDPLTQSRLIKAWGRYSQSKNSSSIVIFLQSKNPVVQIESLRALATHNNNHLVADAVLEVLLTSDDEYLQVTALQALLAVKPATSPKIVERAIQFALKSQNDWLLNEVLSFLAESQPERFINLVRELSTDAGRMVAVKAVNLSYKLNSREATSWLTNLQNHSDQYVQRALQNPNQQEPEKNPNKATAVWSEIENASGKQVKILTNRGHFTLRLSQEAPYTSAHFLELVKANYYTGTVFGRVIPNFVVQGGEHHGDGSGSLGWAIREEWTHLQHESFSVGIATSGKDTGGAQFFVNLQPNHHLNLRYTVFAHVIDGFATAASVQQGDIIINTEIIE